MPVPQKTPLSSAELEAIGRLWASQHVPKAGTVSGTANVLNLALSSQHIARVMDTGLASPLTCAS